MLLTGPLLVSLELHRAKAVLGRQSLSFAHFCSSSYFLSFPMQHTQCTAVSPNTSENRIGRLQTGLIRA
jgi:hypothetical protein